SRTRNEPAALVVACATVRQVSEILRCTFTTIPWRHGAKPSTTVTVPVPTRGLGRRKDAVRPWITWNAEALVTDPPAVTTVMGPAAAPGGTVAEMAVGDTTANGASTDPNETSMTSTKLAPESFTTSPTAPDAGANEVSSGARTTLKAVELVAVPAGVVTLIRPLMAPSGTTAVICELESTVNTAGTPSLKSTAVAPSKFAPKIVTCVPTGPDDGVNESI